MTVAWYGRYRPDTSSLFTLPVDSLPVVASNSAMSLEKEGYKHVAPHKTITQQRVTKGK